MQKGNQLIGNMRKPRWGFDPSIGLNLTQFQAGHGFTTSGADASSNVNDTTTFVFGSQSATVVSKGDGSSAILQNASVTTFDSTYQTVYLLVMVEDVTHLSGLSFSMGNGGFSNEYHVQCGTTQNLLSGVWTPISVSLADVGTNGSPTRSGINAVRVFHKDDNTGNKVTVHYQMIGFMPQAAVSPGSIFPRGVASLSFDDCYVTVKTVAKPLLDAQMMRASVYTIKDVLGLNSSRLVLNDLKSMQDVSGWEINGHTYSDADHSARLTNITAEQLYQDIADEKEFLWANGLDGQGFAYPGGVNNQAVVNRVRQFYRYARTTQSLTETFPFADIYHVKGVSAISEFSGGTSPSLIYTATTGKIDKAIAEGGWLNLVFHNIIPQITNAVMSGNNLTVTFASAHTFSNGASVTLGNFSVGGLNGNWTIASKTTTTITINIGSPLSSPVIGGTEFVVGATTDCSYSGFSQIVTKLVNSKMTVLPMGEVVDASTKAATQAALKPLTSYTSGPQTLIDQQENIVCPSGTFTINLPTAVGRIGKTFNIKNNGTGIITISPNGSETIETQTSWLLSSKFDEISLMSDGANWFRRQELRKNRNELRLAGQGLLSEPYPLATASTNSVMTTQSIYFSKIGLLKGDVVTNVHVPVTTAGTASTSTFVALYDTAGNRLAVSNDLTTALDSTGLKTLALSGAYTVLQDGDYYAAILTVSGSPATIARNASASQVQGSVGSGTKGFGFQSGQSTMPTTATIGTGGLTMWIGVS
jgi:hypothetical protein